MTVNKKLSLLLILSFLSVFKNFSNERHKNYQDFLDKLEQSFLDLCTKGDLEEVAYMFSTDQISSYNFDYSKQGEAIKRALDSGNIHLYNFLKFKYPHFSREYFYEAVAQCRERVARGEEDNCNRVEEYYKVVTKNELPPQGVDLYIPEKDEKIFFDAVRFNNLYVVNKMIRRGFNLNGFFKQSGKTPLHYALCYNADEIARLLVQHGADVRIRTMSGDTPLHIAAKEVNPEMITLLRKNGASVDETNRHGDTPLNKLLSDMKKGPYEKNFSKTISALTEDNPH